MNTNFLSLSNCDGSSQVSPWKALEVLPNYPHPHSILHGHEAITTVFDKTEWMIITGGIEEDSSTAEYHSTPEFHVWLMNLTHADLYGEQDWFLMTSNVTNTSAPTQADNCPPFVSNATDDPWRRADLWKDAVACAPTPRWGHLTSVLNDYLYVFHGYSSHLEDGVLNLTPPDHHVYRIALSDVLANSWSAWRRILPRDSINSMDRVDKGNVTHISNLYGGLWKEYPNGDDLPKLVAFAQIHSSLIDDTVGFVERQVSNQIWLYDLAGDAWELGGDLVNEIDNLDKYTSIIVRDSLVISGAEAEQFYWVDLRTMYVEYVGGEFSMSLPTKSLVTYETELGCTPASVLVGIDTWSDSSLLDCTPASVLVGINTWSDSSLLIASNVVGYSWGEVEVDSVFVNNLGSTVHNRYPTDYVGNTAVLSSAGNMYFFGGLDSDGWVWQINVGGPTCHLHLDRVDTDGSCQYDCTDGSNPAALSQFLPLLIFFPMLFWICGLFDRQSPHAGGRTISPQQHGIRGLSPEQMQTFPQRVLSENDGDDHECAEGSNNNMCSICLVDFNTGDEVRDLPCKHFFHLSCVDSWLQSETTCPLCRESCRPAVDARELEQQQHQVSARLFVLTRIVALLRGDTRERDGTNEVEMGNIYSLEMQVDGADFDDDDDGSIVSNFSSSVLSASRGGGGGESAADDATERRHRRRRRGARRGAGEASEPLTAAT